MTNPRITIDDAMIERCVAAATKAQVEAGFTPFPDKELQRSIVRKALEAALDRRTGPKCRRIEYDDTIVCPARRGTRPPRRSTDDGSWLNAPTKSSRLAREKEAEEIEVSLAVIAAGKKGFWDSIRAGGDVDAAYAASLRAMERVRREEAGRGAPCGATVPVPGTAYRIHERSTDAPRSPGSYIRTHRRKDDK